MGMEIAEAIIDIEQEFGISIREDAACLHVGFSKGCKTIGDLARKMKPLIPLPTPDELTAADGGSAEVSTKIVQILSDRLAVPVERISLETAFRDLGA
jgi:acyl carrier protein